MNLLLRKETFKHNKKTCPVFMLRCLDNKCLRKNFVNFDL